MPNRKTQKGAIPQCHSTCQSSIFALFTFLPEGLKPGPNIREGLRLLDDQDRIREVHLNEVRRKIQTGLDQLDRGEGIPGDQAYAQMKQRSAEFRKRKR
jgi:hypothetical protein